MRIKNWKKFQHFRDRKPPWIKLYRDLLDDREWHNLEPKAAKMLVMLWLLASESDGVLPDHETIAFRLRLSVQQVKHDISRLSQWLEQSDIATISSGYQDDPLETETETETESVSTQKKASRLPEDWEPSDELIAFMRKERPDLNPSHTIMKFCNYWQSKSGKDAVKLDWNKTFQNWVLAEIQPKAKATTTSLDPFAGRGGV
jgi:hypothetical protein